MRESSCALIGRRQYQSGPVVPSAIHSAGEKRQRACPLHATRPLKGTLHPVCISTWYGASFAARLKATLPSSAKQQYVPQRVRERCKGADYGYSRVLQEI